MEHPDAAAAGIPCGSGLRNPDEVPMTSSGLESDPSDLRDQLPASRQDYANGACGSPADATAGKRRAEKRTRFGQFLGNHLHQRRTAGFDAGRSRHIGTGRLHRGVRSGGVRAVVLWSVYDPSDRTLDTWREDMAARRRTTGKSHADGVLLSRTKADGSPAAP